MDRDFTSARNSGTFNKFYAFGRVIGFDRTTNGIAAFSLLIRRGTEPSANRAPARRRIVTSGAAGNRELTTTAPAAPAVRTLILNIAYGRALKLSPEGLKIGSVVEVEGHINSYVYKNDALDKWDYVQYFEADNIEEAPSELEVVFGKKGFSYKPFYISVYLKGEVGRILRDNRNSAWTNFSVRTSVGRRNRGRDVIRVQYSSRMRVNDVGVKLEDGDTVCLVGTVSTTTKADRSGVLNTFENIIIEDMQIVEKKKNEPPVKEADAPASSGKDDAPAAAGQTGDPAGEAVPAGEGAKEAETASETAAEPVAEKAKESAWPEAENDDVAALEKLIDEM